jgi:hypothetical protein
MRSVVMLEPRPAFVAVVPLSRKRRRHGGYLPDPRAGCTFLAFVSAAAQTGKKEDKAGRFIDLLRRSLPLPRPAFPLLLPAPES